MGGQPKLYERYDVSIKTTTPPSRGNTGRWFDHDKDDESLRRRQQLPIEEWTNVEMIKFICQNATFKSKILTLLAIVILSSVILSIFRNYDGSTDSVTTKAKGPVQTKYGERPAYMDPDSHKRSNPFAPEGHQSFMEGVLEIKRVGGNKKKEEEQQKQQQQLPNMQKKRQPKQQQMQKQGNVPQTRQQNTKLLNSSDTFDELNRTHQ